MRNEDASLYEKINKSFTLDRCSVRHEMKTNFSKISFVIFMVLLNKYWNLIFFATYILFLCIVCFFFFENSRFYYSEIDMEEEQKCNANSACWSRVYMIQPIFCGV